MAAIVTSLDNYRVKNEVRENAVAEMKNGYTQIPDDILDAIMLADLTKHQLKFADKPSVLKISLVTTFIR